MFGDNEIMGLENRRELGIVGIFLTIQGEGPHAGRPAIFIRLGGCNLACTFCDTEFDEFTYIPPEEIVSRSLELVAGDMPAIKLTGRNNKPTCVRQHLVVITGGEPMRQSIAPLCRMLIEANFLVQIETNGTLNRPLPSEVQIVYSPKATSQISWHNGYGAPNPDMLRKCVAIKILVSASISHYNELPWWFANAPDAIEKVFFQPIDEYESIKNAANLSLAMNMTYKHGGRLGIQLHKIIGVE